jgi:hypothetical protein
MRSTSVRLLILLAVVVIVAFAFVFIWRARSGAVYGPPVALCPGPDRYGYTCEGADAYAYIDAAVPTNLFADDAVIQLELPFTFTFYGVEYNTVTAATNGNLQFDSGSALAFPSCLAPAAGMGDMISPYWADLDLTLSGALETQTVGEAPARVFVVEWDDAPLYGGDLEDRVTFEVQFFESTNHIVFLYPDPATAEAGNGGGAVVGIQSESQGLSLSFSCLQPVLPTGGGLRFPHPAEPNPNAGRPDAAGAAAPELPAPAAKGVVAELIAAYEHEGPAALEQLKTHWRNAPIPRAFAWQAADLTGDGRDELIAVWNGGTANPGLAQVAALVVDEGRPAQLFERRLSSRDEGYSAVAVAATADLTGDGRADVVLRDETAGRVWVLSVAAEAIELFDVPERCRGGLVARDADGDGRAEIVRDGCDTLGRVSYGWDGRAFVRLP